MGLEVIKGLGMGDEDGIIEGMGDEFDLSKSINPFSNVPSSGFFK